MNTDALSDTVLRMARADEANAIDALMKASTAEIFPRFYTASQTEASIRYIASVDRTLIDDGTYFVVVRGDEIVACGGWSRRDKLYTGSAEVPGEARLLDPSTEPARVRAMFVRADSTRQGLGTRILAACEGAAAKEGFRRLSLRATLPGVLLYERYGFVKTADNPVQMPDGTTIAAVDMEMPISRT